MSTLDSGKRAKLPDYVAHGVPGLRDQLPVHQAGRTKLCNQLAGQGLFLRPRADSSGC